MSIENRDGFKVDDVLCGSWGYDQTNVEYYIVMRVSKVSVWLAHLKTDVVEDGFMCGKATPSMPLTGNGPIFCKRSATGMHGPMTRGMHDELLRKWSGEPMYCSWYA